MKYRLVVRGFLQVRIVYYEESSSTTLAQAIIMMALVIAAVLSWDVRQLDADMAYLDIDTEEHIYKELPEECHEFNKQVGH